jgi:hypothetical protein
VYSTLCIYSWSPYAKFSARGVALNVTTASVQLRVLHNSVYLSARLKLGGTNYTYLSIQKLFLPVRTQCFREFRMLLTINDRFRLYNPATESVVKQPPKLSTRNRRSLQGGHHSNTVSFRGCLSVSFNSVICCGRCLICVWYTHHVSNSHGHQTDGK